MYVEYFLVYVVTLYVVLYRVIASPGESFTVECASNQTFTLVNWNRNNIRVAATERYTEPGECGVISIVKYIKFTVGRCDQHVHQLIINNVSYTENNGVHWSCNTTTTNSVILRVVGSDTTTTATPPDKPIANTSSPGNIETTATISNIETTATIETTSSTSSTKYTEPTDTTGTTEITASTATYSEQMKSQQMEYEPIVIIAGSAGAVVLIIVVAVVVIIVIYKHRQQTTATKKPIMVENDRYVSAGPGVDDADNVNGNQSQCQAKFPEYAKVSENNKPHQPTSETIIMENDLYTSADRLC